MWESARHSAQKGKARMDKMRAEHTVNVMVSKGGMNGKELCS